MVDIAVADTVLADIAAVARVAHKWVAHTRADCRNKRYSSFPLVRQYIEIQR